MEALECFHRERLDVGAPSDLRRWSANLLQEAAIDGITRLQDFVGRPRPPALGQDLPKAINEALCKGCGTCVAACPSASIQQHLFEDQQIFSEIQGLLAS